MGAVTTVKAILWTLNAVLSFYVGVTQPLHVLLIFFGGEVLTMCWFFMCDVEREWFRLRRQP